MKKIDLIYPELCYRIVGILYDAFNNVGPGHKENIYQKAVAIALKKNNITFEEQVYIPIKYKDETIGKYYLDFLIEDKLILEIKKETVFRQQFIKQIYAYLIAHNLKLGIIANFNREGVRFKRIVNIK